MISITEPIHLETIFGNLVVRHVSFDNIEGVVITSEKGFPEIVPIRVQSSCLFSESFLSVDCDCADQLHESLRIISKEGGVVIYLYDEGRGAGLKLKIKALYLQQTKSIDTATAYLALGLQIDMREYKVAAHVINALLEHNKEVEIITNNPQKVQHIRELGINVVRRRSIVCIKNEMVRQYLKEKSRVLGHIIEE